MATTRVARSPARRPPAAVLLLLAPLTMGLSAYLTVPAGPAPIHGPPARVETAPSLPQPLATARSSDQGPSPASAADQSPQPGAERIPEILAAFADEGRDPVLVGAGDIADCRTGADMSTAHLIDGIRGVVFTAGDEAYPEGSAENFRDCYEPSWGRFRDRTLPTIGNHEYGTPGAAGYFAYFGSDAPPGQAWYSMDIGAWHLVVLDSDCGIVGCGRGSPQLAWLKADLAEHPTRCTLAIWHHPRFSSGGHGNDAAVAPFWRVLMRAGAELVVNGHDHDYERFAPQTPRRRLDRREGIREIVAGTGGAHLRRFHATKPNSRVRLSTFGVLRLTLHPSSYSWRFLRTDGSTGDSGTTRCH